MAYQRGSLKRVRRKEGETWVLRYRVTNPDGRRVENVTSIGLVRQFPKDKDAWREADRLGLGIRINDTPTPGRASFHFLAEPYLKADFGADSVRPKSENTISHVERIVRAYQGARYSTVVQVASQDGRSCMDDNCEDAGCHEPHLQGWHPSVLHVETRSKTDYKAIVITPGQTLAILKALPSPLHSTPVLTGGVGRIPSAASGISRSSALVAGTKLLPKGRDFRIPFTQSARARSPIRVYFRRRSPKAGGKEDRSGYRGRSKVWTSQSSPLT